MTSNLTRFSAALILLLCAAEAAIAQAPTATLQGVWKLVEVRTTGPNASVNTSPQPGLFIYTAKHYSVTRVLSDAARPILPADVTKATAAELLAVWSPFQAVAGTYELAGDKVTYSPIVAKNPDVMANGAKAVGAIKLEGNTLWITLLSNPMGPIANPGTLKLIRVE